MKLKGRGWVAVWLLLFLGVLTWVVARQTASHVAATELRGAQERRSSLEAQRAELLQHVPLRPGNPTSDLLHISLVQQARNHGGAKLARESTALLQGDAALQ